MRAPVLALALVMGLGAPAFASLESDVANAAGAGDYTMVKYLTEQGANLNVRDEEGYTPLIWAAQHGNTRVADYLIAHGANLNPLDKGGYTPLMWACQEGHFSTVALLLDKGANPWVRNWRGQTAMDLASTYARDERVRDLLFKAANRQAPAAAQAPAGAPMAFNAPGMAGFKPPAEGGSAPAANPNLPGAGVNALAGNPNLPGTGLNSLAGNPNTPGANAVTRTLTEPNQVAKIAALGRLAAVGAKAGQMASDYVKANITNPMALLDPDLPLAKDLGFAFGQLARDQNLLNFRVDFDKAKTSWNNRQESKFASTITQTEQILKDAGM